ncbi:MULTISPECIES: flagellar biosynthetic protein FliR [Alphaproteobacteria]|uniref:Flagellar biosynthetic protein FliR n=2 Tax=Alphaproteobacteria TaxID=28211 RepID=A0A512HIG4_9HYPH|nr:MULTISPECIES: flagellar biosynthetic protein FliR [Alphaproteobacteria]GEO85233.1 flagellar biosynthetic protein FliR [Ciceribacter naphthalenivorans]GLR24433.1 flagellar biosynthetic protein FliR [Ciceribacter naphthalenivorans]GLT07289.1 flagellar biosynthetic protein FliR [Sphingomonas psychrolutea]
MITDPEGTVLAMFVAFCRIGACFMVLPGFSSARIPVMFRLLMSAAVSLAILPMLWDTIYPRVSGGDYAYIHLVLGETLVGTMYGLIARLYVLGLQFAGSAISMSIGFNSPGAPDVIEDTPENQLTNMISFGGLLLLFMMDFHHVILRALIDSYGLMPLGTFPDVQKMLITLTDTLSATFLLMLRLASPFIIFGLMFNFSIGLINKLAPQIPIYFISTPYLLMGGLFLLYFSIAALVRQFAENFFRIFLG